MSVSQIETTFTENYVLDANPLYTHQPDDLVSSIETCALTSSVIREYSKSLTPDSCNFELTIDKNSQFLSTAFKILIPMSFKFTFRTPLAAAPTEANFISTAFSNFTDLCLSDGGLTNAIVNCETTLDNIPLGISNYNIANKVISPYYSQTMTDEFTQSSVADLFPDFTMYDIGTSGQIKYFDEMGEVLSTVGNSTAPENPFVNSYAKDRNTRTPSFKWVASTVNDITVSTSFWVYLNLGVHTLPSNPTALPGISKCSIKLSFSNNLPGLVFNTRKLGNVENRYRDISIVPNSTNVNNIARIYTQAFGAPTYMRKQFVDESGRFKPYKIHYPFTQTMALDVFTSPQGNDNVQFTSANFAPGSIPKDMYVALVKMPETNSTMDYSQTTNSFGLIDSLEIDVNGTGTYFRDISALHYLSTTNGYDKINAINKQMVGYPIKIDFSKDLNIPGDALIGQSSTYTIRLHGSFRDPHVQRTKAGKFQLVIITVQDAVLHYDGSNFINSTGAVLPAALTSSDSVKSMLYSQSARAPKVLGSGIFSKGINWLKSNVPKIATDVWNNRHTIAKTAGDAINLVKTLKGSGEYGGLQQHNPYTGAGSADKINFLNKKAFM